MDQSKANKKISVRLDSEAALKLRDAKDKGYTTSEYVNDLIKGTVPIDISQYRELIPHLCELESLLEHEEDADQKNAMRRELNKIWQCLKSFQETT